MLPSKAASRDATSYLWGPLWRSRRIITRVLRTLALCAHHPHYHWSTFQFLAPAVTRRAFCTSPSLVPISQTPSHSQILTDPLALSILYPEAHSHQAALLIFSTFFPSLSSAFIHSVSIAVASFTLAIVAYFLVRRASTTPICPQPTATFTQAQTLSFSLTAYQQAFFPNIELQSTLRLVSTRLLQRPEGCAILYNSLLDHPSP